VLWLGHCVYTNLADDARCRETGWVHLRAVYLRNIIGRHHLDAVREAAQRAGYVGRDRSYRAGVRSQAYRILPPYDLARLVRWRVTDARLRANILRWRAARQRETWQRIQCRETPVGEAVCVHLWRNLQRVQLDAEIEFPEPFHPAHQIAVEQIWQGELRFKVDDYGRVHTNLTNLPKTLRPYLSVDGDRLANVDISESQPLFFGIALATARVGRQAASESTAGGRQGRRETPTDTLMMDGTMMDATMMDKRGCLAGGFERQRLPADLRRYLELCEGRALYQTVADRLGVTRDAAKRRVMVTLFDKPWHRNRVSDILDELFPAVMEDMRRIKRPDHRRLAHFAQRVESAFMFGRVVPRIMELRPELFISTIHDSILAPAGDAGLVRQVMLDEFARLGVSPQVKVEPCSIAVPLSPDPASQGILSKAT